MIKWIKFYKTGESEVKTLRLETMEFESEGQTHMFTDFFDASSKSTEEVLVVWDNEYVFRGMIKPSN